MYLQADTFPLVRLHYDRTPPEGADGLFDTFARLLALEAPFVLIGQGGGTHEDSREDRREASLWMKRHREALHRFVIAMVYIEPQAANRFLMREGAERFEKFWSYPLIVAPDETVALGAAHRLLAGVPVAQIDVSEPHDAAER